MAVPRLSNRQDWGRKIRGAHNIFTFQIIQKVIAEKTFEIQTKGAS